MTTLSAPPVDPSSRSSPPRSATTRPPDRLPTLSRAASTLSEKRFLEDNPLLGQRVIPSGAPLPLAAQRDFRGWIVLAIIALIMIGILELFGLIKAVSGRTAFVAPTAERIGAATSKREATDFEASTLALLLVERLESYTPGTASEVWSSVLPYLHPTLHQTMKDDYQEIARKATNLWQHRVAMPLGVASAGRRSGLITMAVFYDSVELTGQDETHRTLNKIIPKAAYMEFTMDVSTKENPIGLVMTRYQTYEKADWISRGFPALWDRYRTPAKTSP